MSRVPINRTVDSATLTKELTAELGRDVAVTVRNPGQVDDRGEPLPGLVVLLDPATGRELNTADTARLKQVITAHTPPPPVLSAAQELVVALDKADTVTDLKAALKAYAGTLVDRETTARGTRDRGGR